MTKKAVFSVCSIFLSLSALIYSIAVLLIGNDRLFFEYNLDIKWLVIVGIIIVANSVFTVLARNTLTSVVFILSFIPYIIISPFILPITVISHFVAYVFEKNIYAIVVGFMLCFLCVLFIIAFLVIVLDDNFASFGFDSLEEISTEYYVSPDGTKEANVAINYWHVDLDDPDLEVSNNTYSYYVQIHEYKVIDLGPVIFNGPWNTVVDEYRLEKEPKVDFKWVDDDTIDVNGQKIDIGTYFSN